MRIQNTLALQEELKKTKQEAILEFEKFKDTDMVELMIRIKDLEVCLSKVNW